jgi:hypothetical protein
MGFLFEGNSFLIGPCGCDYLIVHVFTASGRTSASFQSFSSYGGRIAANGAPTSVAISCNLRHNVGRRCRCRSRRPTCRPVRSPSPAEAVPARQWSPAPSRRWWRRTACRADSFRSLPESWRRSPPRTLRRGSDGQGRPGGGTASCRCLPKSRAKRGRASRCPSGVRPGPDGRTRRCHEGLRR